MPGRCIAIRFGPCFSDAHHSDRIVCSVMNLVRQIYSITLRWDPVRRFVRQTGQIRLLKWVDEPWNRITKRDGIVAVQRRRNSFCPRGKLNILGYFHPVKDPRFPNHAFIHMILVLAKKLMGEIYLWGKLPGTIAYLVLSNDDQPLNNSIYAMCYPHNTYIYIYQCRMYFNCNSSSSFEPRVLTLHLQLTPHVWLPRFPLLVLPVSIVFHSKESRGSSLPG